MFVVKLYKHTHLRIVECKEVEVRYVGPIEKFGQSERNDEADKSILEIIIQVTDSEQKAFYLCHPKRVQTYKPRESNDLALTYYYYDMAYVENSTGATVEVIHPLEP